ncbi:MAG: NAD(P)H-quinone oxidoreductase subunit 4, partial [Waterburya sp.]
LLSMLRQVFYGASNPRLKLDNWQIDAQPREIFIVTCLLLPIIGIGLYPKLATNTYDLKTVEVASKARAALPVIVQQQINNASFGFSFSYNFISALPDSASSQQGQVLQAPLIP